MTKTTKKYYQILTTHDGVHFFQTPSWPNLTSQTEAEIIFLMELNNYGGTYKLIEVELTVEKTENQKITTKIETEIDMTDKIEEYRRKDLLCQ